MDSFKVRINMGSDNYILKRITATDEVDACWQAKAIYDSYKKATSFDLMHVE